MRVKRKAHRQYTALADYYDEVMRTVPYHLWMEYVEEILTHFDKRPDAVLDLACGTGSVAMAFKQAGYEAWGVDISPDMIRVAKRRAAELHLDIPFVCQDICELHLGRTFPLAVCLYDSLNYIVDEEKLAAAFAACARHLDKDGLLIFDVNTQFALSQGLFQQDCLYADKPITYRWKPHWDKGAKICTVEMFFRVKEKEGVREFTEIHYQRAYSLEELKRALEAGGMELLAAYDSFTFRPPQRDSDRLHIVAQPADP